jgi:hypothetical protein
VTTPDVQPRTLRTVLSSRAYLEAPRWHDGRLYVSDMYGYEVLAVYPVHRWLPWERRQGDVIIQRRIGEP